jgi:hypothetical protein
LSVGFLRASICQCRRTVERGEEWNLCLKNNILIKNRPQPLVTFIKEDKQMANELVQKILQCQAW